MLSVASWLPSGSICLSVRDVLQNYRGGEERHDQKAAEDAHREDSVNIVVPTPGGPALPSGVNAGLPWAREGGVAVQAMPQSGPEPVALDTSSMPSVSASRQLIVG